MSIQFLKMLIGIKNEKKFKSSWKKIVRNLNVNVINKKTK